jgi:hypothetical protein
MVLRPVAIKSVSLRFVAALPFCGSAFNVLTAANAIVKAARTDITMRMGVPLQTVSRRPFGEGFVLDGKLQSVKWSTAVLTGRDSALAPAGKKVSAPVKFVTGAHHRGALLNRDNA